MLEEYASTCRTLYNSFIGLFFFKKSNLILHQNSIYIYIYADFCMVELSDGHLQTEGKDNWSDASERASES